MAHQMRLSLTLLYLAFSAALAKDADLVLLKEAESQVVQYQDMTRAYAALASLYKTRIKPRSAGVLIEHGTSTTLHDA